MKMSTQKLNLRGTMGRNIPTHHPGYVPNVPMIPTPGHCDRTPPPLPQLNSTTTTSPGDTGSTQDQLYHTIPYHTIYVKNLSYGRTPSIITPRNQYLSSTVRANLYGDIYQEPNQGHSRASAIWSLCARAVDSITFWRAATLLLSLMCIVFISIILYGNLFYSDPSSCSSSAPSTSSAVNTALRDQSSTSHHQHHSSSSSSNSLPSKSHSSSSSPRSPPSSFDSSYLPTPVHYPHEVDMPQPTSTSTQPPRVVVVWPSEPPSFAPPHPLPSATPAPAVTRNKPQRRNQHNNVKRECKKGWNGRLCGFNGCPNDCGGSERGECVEASSPGQVGHDGEVADSINWECRCLPGYTGADCGQELELNCNDGADNDGDGLVDCADSECCSSRECSSNPLCFSSPDPLDVLLRKQPPSPTSTFFQRMKFLIEEDSVQSYAHKQAFNESFTSHFKASQASVIRGRVVTPNGSGLMGVRVGVSSDPLLGFVVSRENGWFDIMVNGGGTVTLHFQREPFRPRERRLIVPWNEIVVTDDVVMSVPGQQQESVDKNGNSIDNMDMDSGIQVCIDHDYDKMDPDIEADWNANSPTPCDANDPHQLLADAQVLSESLDIPGTGLSIIYNSSRASGYKSNVDISMTPASGVPSTLKYVHLKVSVEGLLVKKVFEADADLKYTFSWNRRNVYKQKVFKVANVIISVGYEYDSCPSIVWITKSTGLPGHDMAISEIGGWNLNVHHRYNFIEGILQRGDGVNVYLNTIKSYLPTPNSDGDYEILSSDERQLYIFNRHGLHIATKSLITNMFIYNFTYTVNTSFGKLTSVTTPGQMFNNKITFLRDHLNQVKEIETSSGVKCRLEMSRTRMLEVFITPSTIPGHLVMKRTVFHYNGVTGLIKSKAESITGNTYNYDYDRNGRLMKAVGPDGSDLKCSDRRADG